MSNLPHEIIVDILSRLPVKPLLRFRCVCKPWRSLIRDPHFVNIHLNRAIGNDNNLSLIIKSDSNLFNLCSPIDYESCNQTVNLDLPFNISTMEIVGSCNGLLCLSLSANCVFLFNPSTNEYNKSPDAPLEYPGYRLPVLGFGYSSTTREYKVVRIVYYFHRDGTNVDSYQSEVTVYTLGTNSWRSIGELPCSTAIGNRSSGKLVNGDLHWTACRRGNGSDISPVILSFDIGDELFRELPYPHFGDGDHNINFLGVLGGCLCMISTYHTEHVDIWVMKDCSVRESWTKQFTITKPTLVGSLKYLKPLGFSKDGEILIQRTDGKLVLYNPRNESIRDLTIHGIPDRFQTVTYVPSLVSLKDNNEVEGQQQT